MSKKFKNFSFVIFFIFFPLFLLSVTFFAWEKIKITIKQNKFNKKLNSLLVEVNKGFQQKRYFLALEKVDDLLNLPEISLENKYELFLKKAFILIKLQLYQRALINFQLADRIHNSATVSLHKGIVLEKMGDMDKALEHYLDANQKDPTHLIAFEKLGDIYFKKKKFDLSHQYYQKALADKANEKNHRLIVKQLINLFILKNKNQFNQVLKKLSYVEKNSKFQIFELIKIFNSLEKGDLSQSIALAQKMKNNSFKKKEIQSNLYLLGLLNVLAKNYSTSIENLKLSHYPIPDLYVSQVLFLNNEILEAIRILKRQKKYFFYIGLYFYYLKDYSSSLEYLKQVSKNSTYYDFAELFVLKNLIRLGSKEKLKNLEKRWERINQNYFVIQNEYLNFISQKKNYNSQEFKKKIDELYQLGNNPNLILVGVNHEINLKNYSLALNYLEKYFLENLKVNMLEKIKLKKIAGDLSFLANRNINTSRNYYLEVSRKSLDNEIKNQAISNLAYIYYLNNFHSESYNLLFQAISYQNEDPLIYYNFYVLNKYFDEVFIKYSPEFLLNNSINNIKETTANSLKVKIFWEASLFYKAKKLYKKHFFFLKKAFKHDPKNTKLILVLKNQKLRI